MEVLIKDIANTYLPELVLLIFIMINMAASIFLHKNMYRISKGLTIVGIVCAIAATFYLPVSPRIRLLSAEHFYLMFIHSFLKF